MALLMYREDQPQVTEFDPETEFGLSTDKKVRIPNIDFFVLQGLPSDGIT